MRRPICGRSANETRRRLGQLFILFCPPVFDDQVLSFDMPELSESLNKYPEIFTGAGAEGENPDACDPVGTLGTGYSRQEDEHS
jgi:hypothetical protein